MLILPLVLLIATTVWGAEYSPWACDQTSFNPKDNYYHPDWMKGLPDDVLISQLSIPGTHDTLSNTSNVMGQCNTLLLKDQLNAGIRLIDIRGVYNIGNENIEIWHGFLNLNKHFKKDVVDVCKRFLDQNPSETIFIRVMENNRGDGYTYPINGFWAQVAEDMASYPGLRWQGPYDHIPDLGSVRGKIVIFQEIHDLAKNDPDLGDWIGFNYRDCLIGTCTSSDAKEDGYLFLLDTQNYTWGAWPDDFDQRWEEFLSHLEKVNSNEVDEDVISVSSLTGSYLVWWDLLHWAYPRHCAISKLFGSTRVDGMNKRLWDYLINGSGQPVNRVGMIYLDFPGGGVIEKIISLNYNLPPVITLLGESEMVLECGMDTFVDPGATAVDIFGSDVTVVIGGDTIDPRQPGTYTVTYDAIDNTGNAAEQVVRTVIVQDTIPPDFKSLYAEPDLLWPPNHRLVPVNFHVDVVDICDPEPSVVLTSVTSNEPDDARERGDGHTKWDIQGVHTGMPDFSILLRAERLGKGDGRIYSITYSATDDSGNLATGESTVTVPHDADHHRKDRDNHPDDADKKDKKKKKK
jgi:hypothetical protein